MQVSQGLLPPSLSHLILDLRQRRQAMLDRMGGFILLDGVLAAGGSWRPEGTGVLDSMTYPLPASELLLASEWAEVRGPSGRGWSGAGAVSEG